MNLTITPLNFVPINDIEGYIRARGITDEAEANSLREKHNIPPPPPKVPTKPLGHIKITFYEDGFMNEKGKMVYPYAEALPYVRAGKCVPFEVSLRCMARNGVPKEVLAEKLKKHERFHSKKETEKREKEWTRLFGEPEKKKVLKAVKKSAPTFD